MNTQNEKKPLRTRIIAFIKDHKIVFTCLAILTVILVLLAILIIPIFAYVFNWFGLSSEKTSGNLLLFFGSYIAFFGTLSLSIVSIIQTSIANKQNDRLLRISEAEFIPIISILCIHRRYFQHCTEGLDDDLGISYTTIHTCDVDLSPNECSSIIVEIKNDGKYPICDIEVELDKYDKHCYKPGKVSTYIAPGQSQFYNICTVGKFGTDKICLALENAFGYTVKVEITIKDHTGEEPDYTYKLLK